MLNPRIYRAAFLPIVFALVLVGFSLRDQPHAATTTVPTNVFDGHAAFAALQRLVQAAPSRRPGSAGDEAVAREVRARLSAEGFTVTERRAAGLTVDGTRELTTVLGERVGFSSRRILVVAHRDALGRGAAAELSGTAALLQLAHVLGGRTLNRTLVLASISGGSGGLAGARQLARSVGDVDAVLVLGDLAGTGSRRPLVVPWSADRTIAPLALRQTVEGAVRAEVGSPPGGARLAVQFARIAFPLTVGDQGPLNAGGVGAVLLSASGELPPAADAPVSEARLTAFGRAALRSISALDGAHDVGPPAASIQIQSKSLPAWPVRLLAAALILPVLLAAIDAFARVRRRRQPVGRWIAWVCAGALPFALAVLLLIALRAFGILSAAPATIVPAGAIPVSGAALAAVAVALLGGWFGVRRLVVRAARLGGDPSTPGAAAAVVIVLTAMTVLVWVFNPFTALLLLPALHLWLLAVAPEVRLRPVWGLLLYAIGLVPPLLIAYAYARQLGLSPVELAWTGALAVAGGQIGLVAALGWSVVLGCAAATLVVVLKRTWAGPPEERTQVTVRGPVTYAGPGSLGGTESALRR